MKSVSKLICLATFFILHFLLHTQLRALAGHILAHATLSYTQVRGHSLATFFTFHSSFFTLRSSLLRYFYYIDNLVDDFHRGDIFGFGLIGDTNTVT